VDRFQPAYTHIRILIKSREQIEEFEVFRAANMKNIVFWDVTPCGSCITEVSEERRFLQEDILQVTRKSTDAIVVISSINSQA
jgi:hypothetical protein